MQKIENKCPVCLMRCDIRTAKNDLYRVLCPRCGEYNISWEARVNFVRVPCGDKQRMSASSALREMGPDVLLRAEDESKIFSIKDLPVLDKIDRLLLALEKRSYIVGVTLKIESSDFEFMTLSWAFSWEEVCGLLSLAQELNLIISNGDFLASVKDVRIKAAGWKRIGELKRTKGDGSQGFVAMSFDDSMNGIYSSCIEPAIKTSGYVPLRVDRREHAGRIDDEIILQIRRSRFIVADMTGHKGGVYYEAGFAHGLGLKVFLTCRDDDFKNLHFDIRQYNCIKWYPNQLEDYRRALATRIEAELGRGPC
ncbi:hypothetical protein LJC36_02485 [Desulfovibrio sp. OttesenSCG-928-C14]|nr:hypothetical protein [Desulfovibrio sp. OttesenSCG-928-C14]